MAKRAPLHRDLALARRAVARERFLHELDQLRGISERVRFHAGDRQIVRQQDIAADGAHQHQLLGHADAKLAHDRRDVGEQAVVGDEQCVGLDAAGGPDLAELLPAGAGRR